MISRSLGLAGLLVGMTASVMMQTALAATMPIIANDLGSLQLYAWVFGAYMLAATVTIPLFGKLSDVLGRRSVYIMGMAGFLVGTLTAGFAQEMNQLVAARVVQGIGAGALAPAALAAVPDLFNEAERGRVFAAFGVFTVVSTLAGPVSGSWITEQLGWRWTFFAIVPVGLAAMALVSVGLPGRAASSAPLDWAGSVWTGASLLLLLVGIHALARNVSIIFGLLTAFLGILSLIFALRYELAHDSPSIPVRLMATTGFGLAAAGAALLGCVTHGAIAFVPLLEPHGSEAGSAGGGLLPMLAAAGVGSVVAGRVSAYRQYFISAAWLATLLAFAACTQTEILTGAGPDPLIIATITIGFCTGLLLPFYLTMATDAANSGERGSASGAVQLARNLGGGVGVPLLGMNVGASTLTAFAGLAGVCGLALLITLVFLRMKTHAGTLR